MAGTEVASREARSPGTTVSVAFSTTRSSKLTRASGNPEISAVTLEVHAAIPLAVTEANPSSSVIAEDELSRTPAPGVKFTRRPETARSVTGSVTQTTSGAGKADP